ncbi:helix-turn-helix domain-containing protein [Flavobacterium weaverense]|uniref:HTH cro/C1-type domain-containing protein n=1 Tax=Flavobacterium weaverense TaxID=271156 RepID=A0A3L9ZRE7_9FLAO|nr:helix-turn-helix transcriptional regulator [Flavobacterium weaverense]RMA74847.1 hypothetical protein BC961_2177 [Flavobacterium weaverense]
MATKTNNKSSDTNKEAVVFLLDQFICDYIRNEWLNVNRPILPQAQELGVHRHIIKKIIEDQPYRVPISTLAIICFYKKIDLSDFFKLIEEKYGSRINDDFVLKTKKDAQ